MKNKITVLVLLITYFMVTACSSSKQKIVEPNNSVLYVTKLGVAPDHSSIVIEEETPFGVGLTFQIGKSYYSALGRICKSIQVTNTIISSFVICESELSNKENPVWELIPAI